MKEPTYAAALAASEKVCWRVEDLIGGAQRLDFSKPFLPEALARTEDAPGLSPRERRKLNQIRAHDYLCAFGLVEEFILPFVLDHVRPHLAGDDHRVRAFLGFAAEEAKHIHLFKCFRDEFRAGFGAECAVIGPSEAVAAAVLAKDPLAVALLILHIEWMTQRHYTESVRDEAGMDPLFTSLLRHHWMEEAQHARLDMLMVRALAEGKTTEQVMSAVREYLGLVEMFDGAFRAQAEMNLASLERESGVLVRESDREPLLMQQHQALRWTFLGSGMTHMEFRGTLGALTAEGLAIVDEAARRFMPPQATSHTAAA